MHQVSFIYIVKSLICCADSPLERDLMHPPWNKELDFIQRPNTSFPFFLPPRLFPPFLPLWGPAALHFLSLWFRTPPPRRRAPPACWSSAWRHNQKEGSCSPWRRRRSDRSISRKRVLKKVEYFKKHVVEKSRNISRKKLWYFRNNGMKKVKIFSEKEAK